MRGKDEDVIYSSLATIVRIMKYDTIVLKKISLHKSIDRKKEELDHKKHTHTNTLYKWETKESHQWSYSTRLHKKKDCVYMLVIIITTVG